MDTVVVGTVVAGTAAEGTAAEGTLEAGDISGVATLAGAIMVDITEVTAAITVAGADMAAGTDMEGMAVTEDIVGSDTEAMVTGPITVTADLGMV